MTLVRKSIVGWDRVPSFGETMNIKKTQGTFDSLLHQGRLSLNKNPKPKYNLLFPAYICHINNQ